MTDRSQPSVRHRPILANVDTRERRWAHRSGGRMVKIKDVMISAMRSVPEGGWGGTGKLGVSARSNGRHPRKCLHVLTHGSRVHVLRVCPGGGSWMCETHIQFGLQSVHTSTLIYIAEWSQDTIMVHRRDAEG